MRNEWKKVMLRNVLYDKEGYIRGPFGSSLKRSELESKGIPVYEQEHVIKGSRIFRFYINNEKYSSLKRFTVQENDILVSCSGTIGCTTVIKNGDFKGIISQALLILRSNPKIIYLNYFNYIINSDEFQNSIKVRSPGSVQINLAKREIIEDIEFLLPPLSEQKAIADVLSSLDDKIELNNKINKNLEAQAEALFKHWFVDFEFPNENDDPYKSSGGEMKDSELGEIPKDWEVKLLDNVCSVITKGTTPTTLKRKFTDKGINFIKAESITDNHSFDVNKFAFIDKETNQILSRSMIKENDILFTIAGTLGRFAFVTASQIPANTNQAVSIIRINPAKINPLVLYSYFISGWQNDFYNKNIQQAVQANLSLTTIKNLPIFIPENKTLKRYTEIMNSVFYKIFENEQQNQKLTAIRDYLLPKLISGEIRVNN